MCAVIPFSPHNSPVWRNLRPSHIGLAVRNSASHRTPLYEILTPFDGTGALRHMPYNESLCDPSPVGSRHWLAFRWQNFWHRNFSFD